jgi:hypothetical protein
MSIEAYSPLTPIDADSSLYVSDGEWQKTAFKRRMTVARISGSRLVVHNPFRLHTEDLAKLRDLGEVTAIVAPNAFHDSETPWMAAEFPSARVFCPAVSLAKLRKRGVANPEPLETAWPDEWQNELACFTIRGLRAALAESVLLHRPSRTLILTDLAFNMGDGSNVFERWFFRWNRIQNRFGPSRIFEWIFVRDRAALAESLRALATENFDRIIMNHGEVIRENGRAEFERAFEPLISLN